MTTLLVTHPVSDFDQWREAFDAASGVRERHGATEVRVLRDGDTVVGLLEFPDDAAAQAFLADPALRVPIPGVPAPPQVMVLSEVARSRT